MDWSIQQVARLAGTTSRTLRHYGDIGLLEPSRIGAGGYRFYDEAALTRLQRILLLRQLGLGLPVIAEVLAGKVDDRGALAAHLDWLRAEQERLDRQLVSVELTVKKLTEGGQLMAEEMFDGFDHTAYEAEVQERWGADAYGRGADWWSSKTAEEKARFTAGQAELATAWSDAAASDADPAGPEGARLAARQYEWLAGIPGTPRDANGPTSPYFLGLADLYVADERFSANYGGRAGAEFVRRAMRAWAEQNLP